VSSTDYRIRGDLAAIMVVSWGLGGGVEPGTQSAAPGVWVTAADSGRFIVGGLQVSHRGIMFARAPAIGPSPG